VNDFNRFLKSPQLRALLQQLDALYLDSSSIRNKVETERLSPAVARFWLTTMRAQLRQIEDLVGEIADELNRLPRGQHNDVQDTG
jgi:hypothetical protein